MSRTRFVLYACSSVLFFAEAGCATPGAPASSTPDRVLASSDAGVIRDQGHIASPSVVVLAPRDSVLRLLAQAYFELGIDPKTSDPAAGRIGNRAFIAYTQLRSTALHEYVNCGTTMTGLAADSYRVQFSVMSTVSPEGAGSKIVTDLVARANDPGTSKGWLTCTSTGVLEARVHALVKKKVDF